MFYSRIRLATSFTRPSMMVKRWGPMCSPIHLVTTMATFMIWFSCMYLSTLFSMVSFHSVAFKTFYIQLWNVNIVHVSYMYCFANQTISPLCYIVTFPSSMTRIRLQDKTVFSLWAMISMVQSEKASLIVVCTSASVSVSIAAVASSSIRIYNQQIH